ncbi:UDP-glucose 4-epimerase GalE [Spiractinospora alimapuensis]|uniref:UDP-glucose 4-epimerase GalE n=1 Tax=Spiractinospora alimapuensis TaxID=2820884 RepID=UPI001EEB44ED|nr:UDP-glucose 4-epimerase GalE [Spiractinospora alimapuensis]QVQ49978.1 UDP-glucose 4-epimerase GalE [Spiractinospora alimapuensis]
MRVLVTGGAGYIGSVVTKLLAEAGHDVVVLDDLSTGHADAVPVGVPLVRADVRDAGETVRGPVDAVVHLAAKSLVSESTTDPEAYWRTNVAGTLALLDATAGWGTRRLVVSSTAAVYGDPVSTPIRETDPAVPTNPYGASKLAVDHMVSSWAEAYDLGVVSLRYFNVAGAWGGLGERHTPETHLIPSLLRAAYEGTEPARIHGTDYPTRDGTAVRDYLHVVDLADAHLRALDRAEPGRFRAINLGSGTGHTVREILDAVRRVTGEALPSVAGPRRHGDPAVLVASNDRAWAELDWTPRRGLEETIGDAWNFERNRSRRDVGGGDRAGYEGVSCDRG